MSNNSERNYTSQEYEQRASNILDGKCEDCPLAKRLIELSLHSENWVIIIKRYKILGALISGAMEFNPGLEPCEGQNCVPLELVESVSRMSEYTSLYDYDEACRFYGMVKNRHLRYYSDWVDEFPFHDM